MKDWSSTDVPDLISIIVTTYNREDALEAVLSALSRQSDRGFEVVVADVDHGNETATAVTSPSAICPSLGARTGSFTMAGSRLRSDMILALMVMCADTGAFAQRRQPTLRTRMVAL